MVKQVNFKNFCFWLNNCKNIISAKKKNFKNIMEDKAKTLGYTYIDMYENSN